MRVLSLVRLAGLIVVLSGLVEKTHAQFSPLRHRPVQRHVFNYTGSNQLMPVPEWCRKVYIKAWGAGGGAGGAGQSSAGGLGGGGAFASGLFTINTTPTILTVVVGQGGVAGNSSGSGSGMAARGVAIPAFI
ncbi:MAG: hypothetical protein HC902_13620 [Calothrix sp. SM1_5_4]|nr:hypothetical protein [Calothrix sp. SM1_5_4]